MKILFNTSVSSLIKSDLKLMAQLIFIDPICIRHLIFSDIKEIIAIIVKVPIALHWISKELVDKKVFLSMFIELEKLPMNTTADITCKNKKIRQIFCRIPAEFMKDQTFLLKIVKNFPSVIPAISEDRINLSILKIVYVYAHHLKNKSEYQLFKNMIKSITLEIPGILIIYLKMF